MPKATNQSNYRAKMKEFNDYVVREKEVVYVTRSGSESLVITDEDRFNLMQDYINAKHGTAYRAVLEDKLIEAGIMKYDNRTYSTAEEMMSAILGEDWIDESQREVNHAKRA